jgi:hypothetical protein
MADPIIDWAWRTPSAQTFLRTFEVHDGIDQRVVMVLVFPSREAAGFLRGVLQQEENERPDPRLVAGYGPSVWRGNVALVESTEPIRARVGQLQSDQHNGMYEDPSASPDSLEPGIAVDLDFQQALNGSDVNI